MLSNSGTVGNIFTPLLRTDFRSTVTVNGSCACMHTNEPQRRERRLRHPVHILYYGSYDRSPPCVCWWCIVINQQHINADTLVWLSNKWDCGWETTGLSATILAQSWRCLKHNSQCDVTSLVRLRPTGFLSRFTNESSCKVAACDKSYLNVQSTPTQSPANALLRRFCKKRQIMLSRRSESAQQQPLLRLLLWAAERKQTPIRLTNFRYLSAC